MSHNQTDSEALLREHELLLKGERGLEAQVGQHHRDMYGDGKDLGLMQKVAIMWRVHIAVACVISALFGAFANELFRRLVGP